MHASVRAVFKRFSGPFEGLALPYMYLDKLGLVTTGTGNLIDPIETAFSLGWRRPDGLLATRDEIAACWRLVKAKREWVLRGGVIYKTLAGNTLRLDSAALDALFYRRMDMNETILRARFRDYDKWPADGQLGVHSMAWALGASWPEKEWPKFNAALRAQDWATCAKQCDISSIPESNGRDPANRLCFTNASAVASDASACRETLVWPASATA